MEQHCRLINGEIHIWFVETLWNASRGLPVFEVDIESVGVLDHDRWFCGSQEPTVRRVAVHCERIMAADLERPVILCPDGVSMDGSHRVAKALIQGRSKIKAVRFDRLPPPDRIQAVRKSGSSAED
jgi:hypothetical protein